MNFYRWMMKKHINTKAPKGDLARDMKGDKTFPKNGNLDEILAYLDDQGACSGCIDACIDAWREYEGEGHRAEIDSGC